MARSTFRSCAVAALFAAILPALAMPDGAALSREGEELYRRGAYAEALKKFEGAIAAGHETGAALYQAGECLDRTLGKPGSGIEMKRRAIPILEKEIAGGGAGVDSYYYLAAIYVNDVIDPVKGTDVARRGAAILENPKTPQPSTQMAAFRAGRLYSFLGKDASAAAWYDKSVAAAQGSPEADRAALTLALQGLATTRFSEKNYAASAKACEELLRANPLDDQNRHLYGRALLMAGDAAGAEKAWLGAHGDELRTELTYLATVVRRWVAAGSPASSKAVPKAAALDDEALRQAILKAGEPLRVIREKDEKEKQAREEKERAERAEKESQAPPVDPEKVRALFKAKMKAKSEPASASAAEETATNDPWRALKDMGLSKSSPPPAQPPPASAEKLAAEKEFFFLMAEYVRRGHLIRNFSFENGLVEMIFR